MNRVAVQRVGILSAFKFGFILGVLLNVVPAILFAIVSKWIGGTLRGLLESWQSVDVGSLLGQDIRVNLIAQLKLDGLLEAVRNWDTLSPLILLLIVLAMIVVGGLVFAMAVSFIAGVYDLTAKLSGGIRVELASEAVPPVGVPALPRAENAGAWLVGTPIPGGSFALTSSPTRIGRDASNQLVLSSQYVAPVHAELMQVNGRWIIHDLSQNNGTFVNDRPVRENMLKDGFRVRLGDAELVFRSA